MTQARDHSHKSAADRRKLTDEQRLEQGIYDEQQRAIREREEREAYAASPEGLIAASEERVRKFVDKFAGCLKDLSAIKREQSSSLKAAQSHSDAISCAAVADTLEYVADALKQAAFAAGLSRRG